MAEEVQTGAAETHAQTPPAAEPTAPSAAQADAPASEPAVPLTPKQRKAQLKAGKAAASASDQTLSVEERRAQHATERVHKAAARRVERTHARAKHKAGAQERSATPARPHERGTQKTRQGVVVSDRAAKTITVRLDFARRHRRYTKIVRTSTTVHAHDEHSEAHIGDTVIVRESRPLSATKRWRLVEVVERAR